MHDIKAFRGFSGSSVPPSMTVSAISQSIPLRQLAPIMSDLKDLPPVPPIPTDEDVHKIHGPGLFKRLTTKLRTQSQSFTPSPNDGAPEDGVPSHKPRRKLSLRLPPASRKQNADDAWTNPEQRAAALRASGLVPARPRDEQGFRLPLSEQEARLDTKYSVVPGDVPRAGKEMESEAERIKEAWMRKNTDTADPALPRTTPSPPPRVPSRSPPPPMQPLAPPPARDLPRDAPREAARTMRPEFTKDPSVAKLMSAMQGYKPENYRPTHRAAQSSGRYNPYRKASPDSDSDSD